VVGLNGSGKSTLLDIVAGRRDPTEGRVATAPTVRLGYYDQVGGRLDLAGRVRDAVAGKAGQPTWEQNRLMERFLFDADAQWAPIGTLSGGERRRLQLLLVLADLPNVLLLDEPTNDLDLDSLRALEDYLEGWPGSLVVVSHDRALLERTVEDVVVLAGDGHARLPPGGYAEYEAARRRAGVRPGRTSGPNSAAGNSAAGNSAAGKSTPGNSTAGNSAGGKSGSAKSGSTRSDSAAARPAGKPKSPSTLRRLVTLAERDMAEAAARRTRLEGELTDVAADHAALAATAHALAEAERALAAAEDRWLSLSEELGG
jgi:ATP-binding cassette subfamily F protein uup